MMHMPPPPPPHVHMGPPEDYSEEFDFRQDINFDTMPPPYRENNFEYRMPFHGGPRNMGPPPFQNFRGRGGNPMKNRLPFQHNPKRGRFRGNFRGRW